MTVYPAPQSRSRASFLPSFFFFFFFSMFLLISCRRLNSIQFGWGQWSDCQAHRQTDRQTNRLTDATSDVDVATRQQRVSGISCDSEAVFPPSLWCPSHSTSHSLTHLPFLATIYYNGRQTDRDRQAPAPAHMGECCSPLSPSPLSNIFFPLSKHVRCRDSGGGESGGRQY